MTLLERRNMLMRGGDSTDWRALFMGMVDRSIDVDLVLPEGITSIGQEAFDQCRSLKSVTIPDTVTVIGAYAFNQCRACTHFVIGTGIAQINTWSFANCVNCQYIVINATTPPQLVVANAFNSNDCLFYVPDNSVAAYKAANNWSALASRIFPISNLNT